MHRGNGTEAVPYGFYRTFLKIAEGRRGCPYGNDMLFTDRKTAPHFWERRSGSLLFVESCDRLGAVLPVTVGGSPILGGNLLCPRIERRGGDRYGYMDRAFCLRYVSHRADLSDRSDH